MQSSFPEHDLFMAASELKWGPNVQAPLISPLLYSTLEAASAFAFAATSAFAFAAASAFAFAAASAVAFAEGALQMLL